jgi:hypothetical protein
LGFEGSYVSRAVMHWRFAGDVPLETHLSRKQGCAGDLWRCERQASAGSSGTVADQPALLLIPQAVLERLEAGPQRYRFDSLEQRLGSVTAFEVVVRDPGAKVVDVVKADVS